MAPIWGRERELRFVGSFVESIHDGPALLILEGEPGIGKTTLLSTVNRLANSRGLTVLTARPSEPEAKLAHAALSDLLAEIPDAELHQLPAPQRQALEAALLRADPVAGPADPRAISMGVLLALRSLAAKSPVLLAIDDWQWIDRPTARGLGFAVRRITCERVGLAVTARQGVPVEIAGTDLDWPEDRRHHLVIGPITPATLHRLLVERLDLALPRPLLIRLHTASQGNPFFGLEIANAMVSSGSLPGHGDPLPVPAGLAEALTQRLAALPGPAQQALAVVGAAVRPTRDLVQMVAGTKAAGKGVQVAVQAGMLQVEDDGRLRFIHPMLGSLVAGFGSMADHRRLHRRLAELVLDDEERAIHLARGSATASDLPSIDAGARSAWLRGAPEIAADLSERGLALAFGASAAELHRRRIETAEYHFRAGEDQRARALLETAVAQAPLGPERARARWQLGWVLRRTTSLAAAEGAFSGALRDLQASPSDNRLRAMIERDLALVLINIGRLTAAAPHAVAAMQLATAADDTSLLHDAIGPLVLIEFLAGRGLRQDLIAKARDGIGSPELPVGLRANVLIAIAQKWGDQFDLARRRLEVEYIGAVERGAEADLPSLLWSLSELECWTGNWTLSAEYAQKGVETAMLCGGPHNRALTLCARAMISACRGDTEQARADAVDALRAAEQSGLRPAFVWSRHALGFAELSRGNPVEAHQWMAPLTQHVVDMGVGEPGSVRFIPDEIEALIGVGQLRPAATLLARFEARARALNRTWALATGARSRGLILAAKHDLDGAVRAVDEALGHHQNLGMPLELGRTLLQSGRIYRRAREKRLAKNSLEAALQIFNQLNAPLWSAQARSDLARVGLRPAARSDLSATETAVAGLAAEGKTNREIAAALFLSTKSVDGVILRVYDKLGIHSRAQLGSWAAAHKKQ